MFLGISSGHCPSSASSAALPVVMSASAGWIQCVRLKIFQKKKRTKKIGMPMYAARKSEGGLLALYFRNECGREHTGDTPVRVVLANKDIKAVEENDDGEVDEGEPGGVWLETTLEDKSVAINSLRLERLVEPYIGEADRAPCEKGGDGDQVLEPTEDCRRATGANGQVCQSGDGGCDGDAPVWDTGFAAVEEESWSLSVLSKSEEVAGSGVEEGVGRRRCGGQDDGVDDRWEDWDTGILDTNNPWRSSSTCKTCGLSLEQMRVI
jgi:hypothetical protein